LTLFDCLTVWLFGCLAVWLFAVGDLNLGVARSFQAKLPWVNHPAERVAPWA